MLDREYFNMKHFVTLRLFLVRLLIIFFWIVAIAATIYFFSSAQRKPNTLNILSWGDIFDEASLREFQEETGISVIVTTASSNEEMFIKLKAHSCDYDLVIPSDYAVNLLVAEDLLKKLDKNYIKNFSEINPLLLNRDFDPENIYSVPLVWEVFGFGINKSSIIPIQDWSLIFTKPASYKICMVNDPLEAINMAALYLYGNNSALTEEQLHEISLLLQKQKKWVSVYSDFRADYFLLTGNCPLVVASSSYILRNIHNYPEIDFVVPESGSFITIENCAIPRCVRNEQDAYAFINFIYRPEIMKRHCERFAFFPALQSIDLQSMPEKYRAVLENMNILFTKSHFFRPIVSEQQKNDTWIFVKS